MTRKTQTGLLVTASVLCCAGVFIGARLSSGSHTNTMDGQKPSIVEATPAAPTPVAETPKSEPTIVAKMDESLVPPPDLSPVPEVNDTRTKAEPDTLPPLPLPANLALTKSEPSSAITLVRADQPVANTKSAVDEGSILPPMPNLESSAPNPSDPPPPPPPLTKDGPAPARAEFPEQPVQEAQSTPVPVKQASAAPKELTEKTATDATPHTSGPTPPSAPLASDNLPPPSAPAHAPSTQDAVIQIKTGRNPVAVGSPSRVENADDLPPPFESGPPARIVPVSPTTSATPPGAVTPVLKKQSTAPKTKVLPLTGTHACKLDEKSGLTLPRAVREQMGEQETLFVTLGSDHCVWLTTAAGLEKLTDRMEKSPAVEDEAKVARRRYFAQTERIAVDKNGYFMIPAALLESVGLKQDAVLIGVGDHFELWDVQRWHKYSQTPGVEPDTTVERHDEL